MFSFCYRYKHWDPEILCESSKVNDYSLHELAIPISQGCCKDT